MTEHLKTHGLGDTDNHSATTIAELNALVSDATIAVEEGLSHKMVKSYGFTSNGIGAGTYYIAGFYDTPVTDANLSQASTTIVHNAGDTSDIYNAHSFIVPSAAGTVDTGQVGLRVNGQTFDETTGTLTESTSAIITTDITTLVANVYAETSEKFLADCEFELYIVSGTPTAYSLDFNYGYAKYDDFNNSDFDIEGIECVGLSNADDSSFNIELLKHQAAGWTYHATAFEPGNGAIVDLDTDLSTYSDLSNGKQFAWKRTDLAETIDGVGSEGFIIRITTGANNSVQAMDIHITADVID